MKIETKKNYTISKPLCGQTIAGTNFLMENYYCEDDRGRNNITAVKLYPEKENDNQYFLEYYGKVPQWCQKWFIEYLKSQKLIVIS